MLDIEFHHDEESGQRYLSTALSGKSLLTIPQLNKGTAFSDEERKAFHLTGKLPHRVENLDEQVRRAYLQYAAYSSNLQKNIYLNNLHDKNQVLFYKLLSQHLREMLPMIYTPIVGTAVKKFSLEFRQPRGLYLSDSDSDDIEAILANRSNPDIDLVVVTDGEGVLGIGDQGIGGMDIPIAKLMVYTLCGGIDPVRTLPICLDVGTNNQALLDDPMYLGCNHPRLSGADYDAFVDKFIHALGNQFPGVFLHWEDFGRANANHFLERYQGKICTFNDDIQGTGAVTLAAILAAMKASASDFSDQRIVIYGAGTAGCGIASQIFSAMLNHADLPEDTARSKFYLIDRQGVLTDAMEDLTVAQKPFARSREEWDSGVELAEVVDRVKPTILIGCSAMPGAFTEAIVKQMASQVERPIIFPLSNPTERCEAMPSELMAWTEGRVIMATGSPFDDISYDGRNIPIAQCNNALVFPGIGLGIIAVKATHLSDAMIWAATEALSDCAPILKEPREQVLPYLNDLKEVAKTIALAVAKQAMAEGAASKPIEGDLKAEIDRLYWEPEYVPYVRK